MLIIFQQISVHQKNVYDNHEIRYPIGHIITIDDLLVLLSLWIRDTCIEIIIDYRQRYYR